MKMISVVVSDLFQIDYELVGHAPDFNIIDNLFNNS